MNDDRILVGHEWLTLGDLRLYLAMALDGSSRVNIRPYEMLGALIEEIVRLRAEQAKQAKTRKKR